ncbi:MAG: phosphatidylserine decarboxylase [Lachnospiraceae bacterium]|nr:phosphatidylserine decarboxylase [Lachnospiraceae bacterium]MBO6298422.1 phosphatidylserine decarboxylase [Lachnospiraceae bacterium]MCR5128953.1 phosphatidylserine decarboxylase [Lachnospiraceae bacterium]
MSSLLYDRKNRKMTKITQYGGRMMQAAYQGKCSRFLLPVVTSRIYTRLWGAWQCTPFSCNKIPGFVKQYHVDMAEYEQQVFRSFDEFFTRPIREETRPMDIDPDRLVAPADSKLLVYPVREDMHLKVKGLDYTLDELTGSRRFAHEFAGGQCLVFRLTMDDYHHYCFPADGWQRLRHTVPGRLHTVSPYSSERKVYQENYRVVNLLETKHFGKILMIEVGALFAGRIINYPVRCFRKGEEKGYFRLGGSTILLLLQKDAVQLDGDIREYTDRGIEVKLRYREDIGTALN